MLTFFFFNDTATTEIYTLSLHDALPISQGPEAEARRVRRLAAPGFVRLGRAPLRPALQRERHAALGQGPRPLVAGGAPRSEEHTSELQSRQYLVCRLLLEKKKNTRIYVI